MGVSHRLPLRLPPTNQPKSPEFAFLEKCILGGKHFSASYLSDFLLEWRKQVREVNVGNGSPQSFDARRLGSPVSLCRCGGQPCKGAGRGGGDGGQHLEACRHQRSE